MKLLVNRNVSAKSKFRKLTSLGIASVVLLSGVSVASAATTASINSKCTKVGAKAVTKKSAAGSVALICTRVKNKLIWQLDKKAAANAVIVYKPFPNLTGTTLTISSWGGTYEAAFKKWYADPFSAETGATVKFIPGSPDPTAPALLQCKQGTQTFDLIVTANANISYQNCAEEFPADLYKELLRDSRPNMLTKYILVHGEVAVIIACNPDLVAKCPANAKEFWDVKNFPGERSIQANYAPAMAYALMADGVPGDKLFPMDIPRAIAKLKEIKPSIKVWPTSGTQAQQVLINKEVGMSLIVHGRAFITKRDSMPKLIMNWDSAVVESEYGLAVPKGAPNKTAAFELIRWISEHPKNQAQWTVDMSYPTAAKGVENLIPDSIANALPSSHKYFQMPGTALAKQDAEIQKAWQEFLTSK